MSEVTYLESIRDGLKSAMAADERVYLIGEDLLDPYGGAFKASLGLSSAFPGQVLNTPISESAITGVATGLALRGMRPVAEIMFGDFLTLCTDQLVNSAAKFPLMYDGKVRVPLVVRTPMGGGRGYGPTHSQSIEKMFLGVPGLTVLSPSLAHDPGALLEHAIFRVEEPVLFIEYKSLYPKRLLTGEGALRLRYIGGENDLPVAVVENFDDQTPDVVVIGYGGACEQLFDAMGSLVDEEIRVRAVLPSRLNGDAQISSWLGEVGGKEPVLIIEHGSDGFNWGSEVAALLYERRFGVLGSPVRRLAANNGVIPAGRLLERETLLSTERVVESILMSIC